ncbi:agamous-like MADS-box protein AGL80 [Aristolochia californica]|uniref:agamous-like MADS-box protein AGL80 n=1 Tax=Aristolochia californica TaxID=171875 RepID=UPI0035DDB45E
MVRSKLEMKFIGDERTRCKVFKKRVEGVKKKGHQLSLLCGIDVFFLCSPPESEKEFSPHSWPPNKAELLRILTRYRNRSNEEIRKHPTTLSAKLVERISAEFVLQDFWQKGRSETEIGISQGNGTGVRRSIRQKN